jgi:hypothetical protein
MAAVATYREMGAAGQGLIGAKVALALAMFAVVFARAAGMPAVARNARFWHRFNLHLAAVVILLAGVLRYLRLEHLQNMTGQR